MYSLETRIRILSRLFGGGAIIAIVILAITGFNESAKLPLFILAFAILLTLHILVFRQALLALRQKHAALKQHYESEIARIDDLMKEYNGDE